MLYCKRRLTKGRKLEFLNKLKVYSHFRKESKMSQGSEKTSMKYYSTPPSFLIVKVRLSFYLSLIIIKAKSG